jgi:hypothetical protein
MPTEEWFKENPKISAYISPNLNQKLSEWMKSRNIKKVSQALTTILEEHLGIVQTEPITQPIRDDRLEAIEQELKNLSQIVQELREPAQTSSLEVVQTELFPVEMTEEIALINANQPLEIIEEIRDNEPDEILHEFLEPEPQIANSDTSGEQIEATRLDEVEKGSLKVEESSSNLENSEDREFKPIMTNQEVSKFLDESVDTIKSRNTPKLRQKGNGFTSKGYQFTTIEGSKPKWKVEKLEDEF